MNENVKQAIEKRCSNCVNWDSNKRYTKGSREFIAPCLVHKLDFGAYDGKDCERWSSRLALLRQEPALPEPKTGTCGRCYDEPVEVFPANCNEKPENLIGQPIGQYHCPDCGAMVVAGSPHPDMCQKCIDRKHPAFDLLKQEQPKPKITDVRMECLKCHRISTVGNAIPDIDGEGSLGCPFCYDKDLERVALVEQPLSDSEQVFPKPLNPAQAAMMGIMPEAIKDTTNIDKCSDCPYNPFGRETAEEKEVNDKLYNTQEPSDSEPSYNQAVERIQQLEAEIEQYRVQLAGCGVAAMQNTEETIKQRIPTAAYGWSASYDDVCRAVDREMVLRVKVQQLEAEIDNLKAMLSEHSQKDK